MMCVVVSDNDCGDDNVVIFFLICPCGGAAFFLGLWW